MLLKYETDNRGYTIANTHECLMLFKYGTDHRSTSLGNWINACCDRNNAGEYFGDGGFDSVQLPGLDPTLDRAAASAPGIATPPPGGGAPKCRYRAR